MAELRIYYLAPLRKTIYSILIPIAPVWMLEFAFIKRFWATTYFRVKPSLSHEFLWSALVGRSQRVFGREMGMRKVF